MRTKVERARSSSVLRADHLAERQQRAGERKARFRDVERVVELLEQPHRLGERRRGRCRLAGRGCDPAPRSARARRWNADPPRERREPRRRRSRERRRAGPGRRGPRTRCQYVFSTTQPPICSATGSASRSHFSPSSARPSSSAKMRQAADDVLHLEVAVARPLEPRPRLEAEALGLLGTIAVVGDDPEPGRSPRLRSGGYRGRPRARDSGGAPDSAAARSWLIRSAAIRRWPSATSARSSISSAAAIAARRFSIAWSSSPR